MRHHEPDEVAHHTEVQSVQRAHDVDTAAIVGRKTLLPEDILPLVKYRRKSAEVIVVGRNESPIERWKSHKPAKD